MYPSLWKRFAAHINEDRFTQNTEHKRSLFKSTSRALTIFVQHRMLSDLDFLLTLISSHLNIDCTKTCISWDFKKPSNTHYEGQDTDTCRAYYDTLYFLNIYVYIYILKWAEKRSAWNETFPRSRMFEGPTLTFQLKRAC